MLTRKPMNLLHYAMAPLCALALLATACSDANTTKDPGATGVIDENGNGTTQDEIDAMNANNASVSDGSTPGMEAGEATMNRTPTQERMSTSADMRGLRVTLMAELEKVRARLNVGTAPYPERDVDQKRAAELAQGLERVDRALESMDAATDETWANMREARIKEVAEVREWLRTYEHGETTVAH